MLQSLQILRCRGLNIIPIKTLKGIKRSLNEVIGSIDLLILTLFQSFPIFQGPPVGVEYEAPTPLTNTRNL